jgi:hypothetical protein
MQPVAVERAVSSGSSSSGPFAHSGSSSESPEVAAAHREAAHAAHAGSAYGGVTVAQSDRQAIIKALTAGLSTFGRNFLLAYNARAGLALLLHLIRALRAGGLSRALSMKTLSAEPRAATRAASMQLGLFIGLYTGVFRAVHKLLLYAAARRHAAHAELGTAQAPVRAPGDLPSAGTDAVPAATHAAQARSHAAGVRAAVAGVAAAGASVFFLPGETRHTLALYVAVRAVQCMYNLARIKGWWHLWGSSWPHGDSLLFALASAQVMYAYALRPESLPDSYYSFMVRTAPVSSLVLQANRTALRGGAADVAAVTDYCVAVNPNHAAEWAAAGLPAAATLSSRVRSAVRGFGRLLRSQVPGGPRARTPHIRLPPPKAPAGTALVLATATPPILPCSVMHPHNTSCTVHTAQTWVDAFRISLPLYASLTVVPMVVLRFSSFMRAPLASLVAAASSATQSTAFLATFVSTYVAMICAQVSCAVLAPSSRLHGNFGATPP